MQESNSRTSSYDVAVIGGGPAGATVSTLLAQYGRRVALIEKDRHPRFHIGESLLPKNLPIFDSLGVSQKISEIGVIKSGAEFVSPELDERQSYFFRDAIDPTPPYAYQVRRAEFDEILIRNAESAGVSVWQDHTVTKHENLGDRWHLTVEGPGEGPGDGSGNGSGDGPGRLDEISARYLIDASGRDGVIARDHDLRRRNREHDSAALFAHYENVSPDAWQTPGNIIIFWFNHGWIWMIPLPEGVTSIGAVCKPEYLKTRTNDLDEFFDDTLGLCPKAWDLMKNAKRVSPVQGAGNYAYSANRAFGDGYLLIGDAYAFVDPVFSSGVLLAMSSAERAAPIVDKILDDPDRAASLLSAYQRDLDRAIKRISWFVYRFNSPVMKYLFMESSNVLGVKSSVLSLLAGDLYRGAWFDWRLSVFKLIYETSRLFPVSVHSRQNASTK